MHLWLAHQHRDQFLELATDTFHILSDEAPRGPVILYMNVHATTSKSEEKRGGKGREKESCVNRLHRHHPAPSCTPSSECSRLLE
jgi:hypothetical protein